jgi:GNAT superfamily N-acetyltransferase
MSSGLSRLPFTTGSTSDVDGFECGDTTWGILAAKWIREGGALASIQDRGTKVWLYINEDKRLVGFGSIGTTRRQHPPGSNDYANFVIIPQIAVAREFWGKPVNGLRYSHQILGDLLGQAYKLNHPLVLLQVHRDNAPALRLYEQFQFHLYRDANDKGYVTLAHKCP